jgi:hypothetical protein
MAPKRRLFISRTTIEYVLDAEHLVLNWTCLRRSHRHLQVSSRPPPARTLSLLQGLGGYGVMRDDACSWLGVLFEHFYIIIYSTSMLCMCIAARVAQRNYRLWHAYPVNKFTPPES